MHTDISVLDMKLMSPSSTNNRKADLNSAMRLVHEGTQENPSEA